jgi:hypothetical protein
VLPPRDKLVKELLDTEQAHVHLLELFVQEFLTPLRNSSMVEHEDVMLMASNVELLLAWNQQFLRALKKTLKRDLTKNFAQVLLHMVPMLRQLYTQYCENYERALTTYERCKTSKVFMSFLSAGQEKCGRDFLSCMYLPIGRMIAYDTLLNSILSHTAKSAVSDHRDVARALQALRAVAHHANERALQRKNIDRVLAIQDEIGDETIPPLAVPHRRYVYEGTVTALVAGASREAKDRHLFLFNDLIICVRPSKRSRGAGSKIWDVEFLIGDLHTVIIEDEPHDTDPYRFCLRTPGAVHSFSSPEKSAWIQLVQDVISRLNLPASLSSALSEPQSEKSMIQELTKENLIAQILEWGKSDNAEAVLMEVKELAQAFHKTDFEDDL